MRRRTMTMTMFAVSVAVVLLGIPLGGAWIALAFRTTPNAHSLREPGTTLDAPARTRQDRGALVVASHGALQRPHSGRSITRRRRRSQTP